MCAPKYLHVKILKKKNIKRANTGLGKATKRQYLTSNPNGKISGNKTQGGGG